EDINAADGAVADRYQLRAFDRGVVDGRVPENDGPIVAADHRLDQQVAESAGARAEHAGHVATAPDVERAVEYGVRAQCRQCRVGIIGGQGPDVGVDEFAHGQR